LSESKDQQLVIRYFKDRFKETNDPVYEQLIAIPNEGKRAINNLRRMIAEGMRIGMADLVLFVRTKDYGAACVELKAPEGTLKNSQSNCCIRMTRFGYLYKVIRDPHAAIAFFESYIEVARREGYIREKL